MASKTPDPALLADASALQIETARAILAWIVENGLPIGPGLPLGVDYIHERTCLKAAGR